MFTWRMAGPYFTPKGFDFAPVRCRNGPSTVLQRGDVVVITWATADRGDTAMCALRMGERLSLVESNRTEIQEIVRRHSGRSVALLGSVARGDDTAASDIDFLVEFLPGSSLFDLLHISDELEALLGMSVDVVSVGGLKARDDHIRRETMPL